MRILRLSLCGAVVASRELPDVVYEDEMDEIRDDVKSSIRLLKARGPGAAWVTEGNVMHLMGKWS